jgi:hypothetical protein
MDTIWTKTTIVYLNIAKNSITQENALNVMTDITSIRITNVKNYLSTVFQQTHQENAPNATMDTI